MFSPRSDLKGELEVDRPNSRVRCEIAAVAQKLPWNERLQTHDDWQATDGDLSRRGAACGLTSFVAGKRWEREPAKRPPASTGKGRR